MINPVLFSRLKIRIDRRLHLLAVRIAQRPSNDQGLPREWIQVLDIEMASISRWDLHMDALHTILIHAHCLRAFRYHGSPIRTSHLLSLARIPDAHLRILLVNIGSDNEACIPFINELSTLEDLTVHFNEHNPPQLTGAMPLTLPASTRFHYQWKAQIGPSSANILFSSSFPRVQAAHFVIPRLTQQYTTGLKQFLHRSPELESFLLDVPPSMIADLGHTSLQHVKFLSFPTCVPPPTFMDTWAPSSPLLSLTVGTAISPTRNLFLLFDRLAISTGERLEARMWPLLSIRWVNPSSGTQGLSPQAWQTS
jgi:hypothetical protein